MAQLAHGITVTTFNGYDLHAAVTSPGVETILLAGDAEMTLDTCPAPHTPDIPATQLKRNLFLGAADSSGRYPVLDCNLMSNRILVTSGYVLTLKHLILRNCSMEEEFQFFEKANNATIVFDDVIENKGSTCAPPKAVYSMYSRQLRPAVGAPAEQQLQVAEAGTNWCIPENTLPGVPRLTPSTDPLCDLQALLLQDVVLAKPTRKGEGTWYMVYRNVVQVRLGRTSS
jgi:hypothetical protein